MPVIDWLIPLIEDSLVIYKPILKAIAQELLK